MQHFRKFSFQDLDDLVVGAHFLASGGGGSLQNGLLLVEQIKQTLQKRGLDSVAYLDPNAVPDDAWLPVLGAVGAPQKFIDCGYGASPVSAFDAHERLIQGLLGQPSFSFYALIAAETGAIASCMALLVGATLGLPVLDGDGAGRAVPSLPLLAFANPSLQSNISISPCSLSSETAVKQGGVRLSFDCNEPATLDRLVRSAIAAGDGFEQRAALSGFAMTGAQLKQPGALVHNTLTRARDLGRLIRTSSHPVPAVLGLPGAALICNGEITGIGTSTQGGADSLDIRISSGSGGTFVVAAKNGNMLVWSSQQRDPLVHAPDLICYIQNNGVVLSNSEIVQHFHAHEANSMPINLISLKAPKETNAAWLHAQYAKVFASCGYDGGDHPPFAGDQKTEPDPEDYLARAVVNGPARQNHGCDLEVAC